MTAYECMLVLLNKRFGVTYSKCLSESDFYEYDQKQSTHYGFVIMKKTNKQHFALRTRKSKPLNHFTIYHNTHKVRSTCPPS
ncbi:hypothetical protein Hanom_Chr07g00587651 [Helianthus anomalus]